MTSDAQDPTPHELLDQVADATARLLDTVRGLGDGDVIEPSLLPGWTRGHVLAHLARNADSLVNLLIWARTGIETPQYASPFLREFDIDAGAPRPIAEQLRDIEAAANRWSALATTAPPEAWTATVRTRQGRAIPAAEVPWMRLLEVEIHHVDLAASYTPADWPTSFVTRALPRVAGDIANLLTPDIPPFDIQASDLDFTTSLTPGTPTHTVLGPAPSLLAWLIGRSSGEDLSGPLPELPGWR
ncbi:maleylpyruvate isomerase [Nocardia amikacinitolerans]|uniref:Maleylpyruvate isomerase n=1 Tax=Nocardia amikacinitolerans TaxID=756689 RepID=A0A285LQB9_9NOCA|nr:maleylpyruvate isomerase family mycothiol-dependent enzyme [Nocardia amikacinitolerans]MCP2276938.1 maleylpyruvate isomerase [Nocardia amikacinitolerans]MCP2294683.1 maleylpyruvate isomerase [Nocardia amikacinitolerans]MCP2319580.1 maleylpyruvate isomerase [Nocardia amikacinitolerans]SNY87108.1 maleylpyruvate isomerase [Nocardia amikacinitolerans]